MHRPLLPLAAIVFCLAPLTGCETYPRLNYSEYRGQTEFPGKGGAVIRIADFDIWTVGEPDRPFRVLGVIEATRRGDRTLIEQLTHEGERSALLRFAREKGGEGLIFIDSQSQVTGFFSDVDTFGWHYRRYPASFGYVHTTAETQTTSRVAVVQYLATPPSDTTSPPESTPSPPPASP